MNTNGSEENGKGGRAGRGRDGILTARQLWEEHGMGPRDVREAFPHATAFTDDDGNDYYLAADLLGEEGGEE